ncbi:MAG: PDZ domain-containing protein [Gammaproteobacteria bacterium]
MSQSKLLLVLTLLAGIGLGAWAREAISSEPPPLTNDTILSESSDSFARPEPPALQVIDELRDELERAQQERDDLRNQLEALSVRLSALDKQPVADLPNRNADAQRAKERASRRRGSGALTVAALTEAGISERDASSIKSRLDELAMQRLYLRDQAQREGWLGKEEYRSQIRQLNDTQNNLPQEIGEDNYSRYLYAMGRPNQVNVQSVIENSPAYNAGMQTGDRLVSYDSQSVYDARNIRQGTRRGTAGEMVPMVVMRNGQRVELYVPRGPLGITMNSQSVLPTGSP